MWQCWSLKSKLRHCNRVITKIHWSSNSTPRNMIVILFSYQTLSNTSLHHRFVCFRFTMYADILNPSLTLFKLYVTLLYLIYFKLKPTIFKRNTAWFDISRLISLSLILISAIVRWVILFVVICSYLYFLFVFILIQHFFLIVLTYCQIVFVKLLF